MYVAQVHLKFEPTQLANLLKMGKSIVDEMRKLPGCQQLVVVRTSADSAITFTTYRTQVEAEAATPEVARFFQQMAPHLTVLPRRDIYPALIYEQFGPITP